MTGKVPEERKLKLRLVADLLGSEDFTWKSGGFFSADDVVGVLAKGTFSKGVIGTYYETTFSKLISKNGLIGDGNNWFPEIRFRKMIESLKKTDCGLLLSKTGNKPAIISLTDADIMIAPYIA